MRTPGAITGLLALIVVVGVLAQTLKNPQSTVKLALAGADVFNGTVHGLEGQKAK